MTGCACRESICHRVLTHRVRPLDHVGSTLSCQIAKRMRLHRILDLNLQTFESLGLVFCFEGNRHSIPTAHGQCFLSRFQLTLQLITLKHRTQRPLPLPLPFSLPLAVSFDGLAHQLEIIRMSFSLIQTARCSITGGSRPFKLRTPSWAPISLPT